MENKIGPSGDRVIGKIDHCDERLNSGDYGNFGILG